MEVVTVADDTVRRDSRHNMTGRWRTPCMVIRRTRVSTLVSPIFSPTIRLARRTPRREGFHFCLTP